MKNKLTRLSNLLAHPFIITIFASGILVYIGYSFNHNYDLHQKQSSYLKEITDKKFRLIAETTSAIDKEMSLLYQIKYYRMWLTNLNNKIDEKGRSRSQVIKEYEKTWSTFNICHNSISTLSQVSAFYDDENIIRRAKCLISLIDNFQETNFSETEQMAMRSKINKIYVEMYKLSDEMGIEVKREIKKNTNLSSKSLL